MHVIDLEGHEYPLQATSTNDGEVAGHQEFSATIIPSKVNKAFINNLSEMWCVVDHDDVEHKIIYAKRQGEGNKMTVKTKAIPLFFDDMDNQRVERRVDKHMTAEAFFDFVFNEPDYQGNKSGYGYVLNGSFSAIQWEGLGEGETRLKSFKRGLDRYKCEFRIVGRTIYIESQIGRDTSIQYRHKLNASNIVEEIDANEMWTYAKGYGDYEDGESDSGEGGWENAKLVREYTSPLADIIGMRHAPPIMNGNISTKSKMDSELKTLVDESLKISVSADIYDLKKQGYPIAQSQLGDRVFLIDPRIGLNVEVRVVEQSIKRDWKGNIIDLNITFGSEGLAKRHQANISTAVDNITELLEGKKKLPYSVLDDAVKEVTETIKGNKDSIFKYMSNGVMGWNGDDPNYMTRYVGDAIGFSDDGGNTFGTAMSAKDGIVANYIRSGTMLADRIAGGILASLNGHTVFNLNDGRLVMENTYFELGGGADIRFLSIGNRLYYSRNDWSAGVGVGRSINDTYPYAFLGAVKGSRPHARDESDFSGFIANTNDREKADDVGNSVVGNRFHVRDTAVSFSKGFLFRIDTGSPYLSPMNSGSYDYDLGRPNNRWNNTYLKSNPNVSSDRRIKKDIADIDLEFAMEFLQVNSKRYRKRLSNATLSSGVIGSNPYEFGFIAQDIEPLFEGKDMRFESLVSTSKNGDKSMQYGQISAIHHVLLQNAFKRIEKLEELSNG